MVGLSRYLKSGMLWGLPAFLLMGCATHREPLSTPVSVDLERFMGPWFVVGYTPLIVDKRAHNAVEHYFLAENGKIQTTYQFRKGSFDGPIKTYKPVGWVDETESNARWKMQFVWPFSAQYVIAYLSENYERTVIAHPNRKYAWLMQRSPDVNEVEYQEMLSVLERNGFDPDVVQRVPHDWSYDQERMQTIREVGASAPLEPR